jgi:hypothetical protein
MNLTSGAVVKQKKKGRPDGVDPNKLAIVVKVLAENPDGLWLRRIAKKAGLHPTTVGNYVDSVLRPLVDDVSLGADQKPIIRVIKLKASVIRRLEQGATLRQILQLSQVLKTVGKGNSDVQKA